MAIIGVAGHLGHGKSSLVRALAGQAPDDWISERLRGLAPEVGWASLAVGGGEEATLVDLPGHPSFIHALLAGADGVRIVLLVVAVDEGLAAQTFEHLAIFRALGVERVVVALTKTDLASSEEIDAMATRLRRELFLPTADEAAILPTSAMTGAGLVALRARVAAEARAVRTPPEAPTAFSVDDVVEVAGGGARRSRESSRKAGSRWATPCG